MHSALDLKTQDIIFTNQGYLFMPSSEYGVDVNSPAAKDLMNCFNHLQIDPSPGSRYRSYLKLLWNRAQDKIKIAENQRYYQTYDANIMDGGKVRKFQIISLEMFNNEVLQKMIAKNVDYIRQCKILSAENNLIFGIHFIRYYAVEGSASYSSPTWLHTDDEPVVFLHLVKLTDNLIGGDSIIGGKKGLIKNVFKLKNFMDTLIVNRNSPHAVTPMGSSNGIATRDIILFTVEPSSTNGEKMR